MYGDCTWSFSYFSTGKTEREGGDRRPTEKTQRGERGSVGRGGGVGGGRGKKDILHIKPTQSATKLSQGRNTQHQTENENLSKRWVMHITVSLNKTWRNMNWEGKHSKIKYLAVSKAFRGYISTYSGIKKREHLILSIVRVDFCVCCSDLKERTSDFKHSKSKCLRLLYPTAGERGGETDIHYIQNIEAKSNLKDLLIMFTLMCTCDVCKRSESICINPRLWRRDQFPLLPNIPYERQHLKASRFDDFRLRAEIGHWLLKHLSFSYSLEIFRVR